MADDTSKRGESDRSQVAGGETYEVDYFAEKHGISRDEASALIDRVGNDRAKLDAAAEASKKPEHPAKKPARQARKLGARTQNASRVTRSPSTRTASNPSSGRTSPSVNRAGSQRSGAATVGAISARVEKEVAPAKRQAKRAVSKTVTAVRRRASSVRATTEKLPATAKKRASDAVRVTKSAVTGPTARLIGAAAVGLAAGLAANLGRKALVQSPSVLAGDWFEAIKVEHRAALLLFDQLQATDDTQTGKRSTLLTQLKHALGKHAFTEENILYPALRDWGDKADADKLNHDHGYVKQSLFDLEEMDKASSAFLVKVAAFRADLEAHIREEEEAVFPPLHAALGDKRNRELTVMANKEGLKLA